MIIGAVSKETFFPLGTAFIISRLGTVISAKHVIEEAARHHAFEKRLRSAFENRSSYNLDDVGFSVLYNRPLVDNEIQVVLWPLHFLQIARPTDIVVGSLTFNRSFPYGVFSISPGMPKAKSTILSVGYADFPPDGIRLQDIADGSFVSRSSHRLIASEGSITAIHNVKFARGYLDGPCFSADVNLEHGRSGGPVFDSAGHVCGINSAGLEELGGLPGSLFSMLYPALLTDVSLVAEMAEGKFKLSAKRTILELIRSGHIKTDGSEHKAIVVPESATETGVYVSHIAEDHNLGSVFDDFGSLTQAQPAQPSKDKGISLGREPEKK